MMLGFLLARAGVEVAVLEKHKDFFRDFRGDTIHPSTLELMHELGLLEDFLKRPHSTIEELGGQVGDSFAIIADFRFLPTHCKCIVLMPQWDFLDFIAAAAGRHPQFRLLRETEFTDLMTDAADRVTGVRARTGDGTIEIAADLVVGCDGRHSDVRAKSGFSAIDLGAPMDVLWLRLSKKASDGSQTFGRIESGHMLVTIDRNDYWQCAYLIPKGEYDTVRRAGLDAFRAQIARLKPEFSDRTGEIKDWDDVKLLTVAVDRLRTWHRPGLLVIGDAAHAMSPIGGVGINLAIQDAVAAANILAAPLLRHSVGEADLAAVQKRRMFPTRMIQGVQLFVQNKFLSRVLAGGAVKVPLAFRLLQRFPILRRLPARLVGVGFRPEHVRPA
jgi:2-polyprenyl-6-methoxyphenol hydroxylase-like FAD-dependent oxidoreductase